MPKIDFGWASRILLGFALASLVPVIETWVSTGIFPTDQAWITAGLTILLGIGRYAQAIFPKPALPDDEIPGGTPTP